MGPFQVLCHFGTRRSPSLGILCRNNLPGFCLFVTYLSLPFVLSFLSKADLLTSHHEQESRISDLEDLLGKLAGKLEVCLSSLWPRRRALLHESPRGSVFARPGLKVPLRGICLPSLGDVRKALPAPGFPCEVPSVALVLHEHAQLMVPGVFQGEACAQGLARPQGRAADARGQLSLPPVCQSPPEAPCVQTRSQFLEGNLCLRC